MKENKMSIMPVKKLIWNMGIPMIISMVLQALYNVIDTAFVINMGTNGEVANLALGYVFPVQIFMIAVGVGTGIGINALLSRYLGAKENDKVNRVAGNGIFIAIVIYLIFILFGFFGSRWFVSLQANGNTEAINMGESYLKIICVLSFGSIGYTVYERFLQATGETMFSTISQICGAVCNIILDYVFIYPLNMGIEGAAYATIIGQILSLLVAMFFHYFLNKEIDGKIKFIKPNTKIIFGIYKIGASAALMQSLLAVMMFSFTLILGLSNENVELLQGTFAIYYKIQQIALFASFGLSNALITIASFNYGCKNKNRLIEIVKYGLIDSVLVALVISLLYESCANPLSQLFGMTNGGSSEIVDSCVIALRISSISYIFMAISVGIQGIMQALKYAIQPLIISFLRLIVFVLPFAYLFVYLPNSINNVWWSFVIAEVLTSFVSILMLKKIYKEKILSIDNKEQ